MVDSDRIHELAGSRRQFARVYDTSDTVAVYGYAMRQFYISTYLYVPVMRLVS